MKKLLFLFILNLISFQIFSCQVITTPFKIAQPNGDSIIIVQRGDEYGSWYETLNGYVIKKNSSNFWVYVKVDNNGDLILTNQIVSHTYNPTGISLNNVHTVIDNYRQNFYNQLNNDALISPNLEDTVTAQAIEQGATLNISQVRCPAKNKGNINVLTILIQFKDVKFVRETLPE